MKFLYPLLMIAGQSWLSRLEIVVMSCSSGSYSVRVTRHYTTDPREETAVLRSGSINLLTMTYRGNAYDYYNVCLTPGRTYTLRLMDEYGDGWSANSYIELTYGGQRVVYGTLLTGYLADIDFFMRSNLFPVIIPTTEAPSFIEEYGLYFLLCFGGGFFIIVLIAAIVSCSKSKKTLPKQPTK